MYFCDNVEKFQEVLKKLPEKIKGEKKPWPVIIVARSNHQESSSFLQKDEPCTDNGGVGVSDEDLDSPISTDPSTEYTASLGNGDDDDTTASTSYFNLRKKSLSVAPPDLKNCSIFLERLDIQFEPSSSESEEEEEEIQEEAAKSLKRPLDTSGSSIQSPSKRMRISSPLKAKMVSHGVIYYLHYIFVYFVEA